MPTENPKISAYVPQIIYDRFKQFQEEREISTMSQAVTELFAEYFGINLIANSTKEFIGGLPDRVFQLEQIVADLKQSHVYLSERVDLMESTDEPHITSLSVSSSNGRPYSEPLSKALSESPSESDSELPITKFLIEQENKSRDNAELPSGAESELPVFLENQIENTDLDKETNSSLSSNPLSSSKIKINYSMLALRLGLAEGSVKIKKSTSSPEEFTEWSIKRDQDKIGWQSTKESKRLYFYPVTDLSDEQKANLQEWLAKNQAM